jgi:hypothetical protein
MIFGKVLLMNLDNDYQDASATLVGQNGPADAPSVIDQSFARLPPRADDLPGPLNLHTFNGSPGSFSLQAPFFVYLDNGYGVVRLTCATAHGGLAWGAQLAAIAIDDMQSSTGGPPGGVPQHA